MSEPVPEGFSATVYRSLTQPVLVAGVPKRLAVGLGMVAALALVLLLWRFRYWLQISILEGALYALYRFSAARCKRDPHYFSVLFQNRGPRRLVP